MFRHLMIAAAAVMTAMAAARAEPPKVIASIAPLGSLVAEVMRGVGTPMALVPLNASPHSYAMRPSEARDLATADVVFWVGPDLETFLTRPLETLAGDALSVALVETPGLQLFPYRDDRDFGHDSHETHGHGHGHGHGHAEEEGTDPHVWLSLENGKTMLRHIAATLAKYDPPNAAAYLENARAAAAFIDTEKPRIAARLDAVRHHRLMVFHDAFQYFEKEFGLDVAGAITLNPETPPGARRIVELRRKIREEGVTCVLFEPQMHSAVAYALAQDAGIGFSYLDPMGPLAVQGIGRYVNTIREMAESLRGCDRKPD